MRAGETITLERRGGRWKRMHPGGKCPKNPELSVYRHRAEAKDLRLCTLCHLPIYPGWDSYYRVAGGKDIGSDHRDCKLARGYFEDRAREWLDYPYMVWYDIHDPEETSRGTVLEHRVNLIYVTDRGYDRAFDCLWVRGRQATEDETQRFEENRMYSEGLTEELEKREILADCFLRRGRRPSADHHHIEVGDQLWLHENSWFAITEGHCWYCVSPPSYALQSATNCVSNGVLAIGWRLKRTTDLERKIHEKHCE